MSLTKRRLEEIEGRGFRDVDAVVCSDCLTDPWLSKWAAANGLDAPCNYCGSEAGTNTKSIEVEALLELVLDGLNHEYEDPNEQMAWDEGDFVGPTYSTEDLLAAHEVTECGQLLEDLCRAIVREGWCRTDPYWLSRDEALTYGWQRFRQYVKHERRFTFLQLPSEAAPLSDELQMHEVPGAVVASVQDANLLTVLPEGTTFWRARPHKSEVVPNASELGAPPDEVAQENRMSPRGIGAFHAATTLQGAVDEVARYADPASLLTVGRFRTAREYHVIDLADLPELPSLFDAERRHIRAPLIFLRGFAEDIRKASPPSDRQNLEYVPTQVIAEALRYGFDHPVHGVLWRSSLGEGVTCCCLFFSNDEMADDGQDADGKALILDRRSVKHFEPSWVLVTESED